MKDKYQLILILLDCNPLSKLTMIFREKIILYSQPGMIGGPQLDELVEKVKELDMDMVRAEIAEQEKQKQA